MRGNDGSRSPRVTEYSSMFSLGDSLARYCATFARQRAPFFPYFAPLSLPLARLALLFHRFPLPFVRRFEIETAPRSSRLIKLRGRGGGGPASIASGFPRARDRLPGASRGVPVPRATRYSGRSNFSAPRSCASPYLATYPNVTDDYRARGRIELSARSRPLKFRMSPHFYSLVLPPGFGETWSDSPILLHFVSQSLLSSTVCICRKFLFFLSFHSNSRDKKIPSRENIKYSVYLYICFTSRTWFSLYFYTLVKIRRQWNSMLGQSQERSLRFANARGDKKERWCGRDYSRRNSPRFAGKVSAAPSSILRSRDNYGSPDRVKGWA